MRRRIDLHGHRGARGLFPENTLVGFTGALAVGVDALELDVAVTADQVVVVTHDPRLNPDITRTRDGTWLAQAGPMISSLRVEDLRSYDVGRIRPDSRYAALYPDQKPHDGATIPTLADALRIDPRANFNIELKTFPLHSGLALDGAAMADAVVAAADPEGGTARIMCPILRLAWTTPPAPCATRHPTVLADQFSHPRRRADMVGRPASIGLRRLRAACRRGGGRAQLGP